MSSCAPRALFRYGALWLSARSGLAAAELAVSELGEISKATGATLFSRIDAAEAGLAAVNRYEDPRIWTERYHEFSVGAVGTGVAVGDYDADGRPDIFVARKTECSRLYRNLGDWRFEDVTAASGLTESEEDAAEWKQGATWTDVNNDGWLDLYLGRFQAPNRLWVNQGDGTFREEAESRGLALSDASGMAAFADYDRDGWLDCYVQTNVLDKLASPDGQLDRLYRNLGDGVFEETTAQAGMSGPSQGHSAIWWDYDEDGWPDLYVANDFAVRDRLYRNRHDGTFEDVIDKVAPHMPHHAMGADLGDVDNDGRTDLLVAEMARSERSADLRTAAETRTGSILEPVGSDRAPQTMYNALYLNTGGGRMEEAAQLAGVAATNWTWSVRWEDFDNDGRLDLHVTNGMVREYDSYDLRAKAMAAEKPAQRVRVMMQSPELREANLMYRGSGDGLRMEDVSRAWGVDEVGVSFGAATGDFDGDGDLDLVVSNYREPVSLWRNDSESGDRLVVALRGTRSNRLGVGARVEVTGQDGQRQVRTLSLARGYLSSSEPILHFGLGESGGMVDLRIEWPSGIVQEIRDVARNTRCLVKEPAESQVALKKIPPKAPLFRNVADAVGLALQVPHSDFDEAAQQPLSPRRLGGRGPFAAVADFNGDGRSDVAVGGNALARRQLLFSTDNGDYQQAVSNDEDWTRAGELGDGPMLACDADGDGDLDLLISKAGMNGFAGSASYQPEFWLNQGGERFDAAPQGWLPDYRANVGALAAADFDKDGNIDVFLGGRVVPGMYPVSPDSAVWLGNGRGFQAAASSLREAFRTQGMVTAAEAVDIDRDGWTDLVVATEWGPIRVWINEDGASWRDATAELGLDAVGNGLWQSLAIGDFNGDGAPDIAAGNLGLNSPYRASRERPIRLYLGDFGGSGRPTLVEAVFLDGRWAPRRARSDLAKAVRGLGRRFRSAEEYAAASLPELLGEDRLAEAEVWEARELRSGVFLSHPDGTYRFAAMDDWAQLSPVVCLAADDVDRDGKLDILAAQNLFGMAEDIGRLDGGVGGVWLGDGRGNFERAPPDQTGWVAPGQPSGLFRLTQGDGRSGPVWWVPRSGEPAIAFEISSGDSS